jgi:hypothetical protein
MAGFRCRFRPMSRRRKKTHGHHRSLISISWTTCSPRRASRGASYGRKSEQPASTRTHTSSALSSLGARSFASRATERRAGGAETKTSDSIGLERRNKRHGAPGDTGHLVACPLAGGVSHRGASGARAFSLASCAAGENFGLLASVPRLRGHKPAPQGCRRQAPQDRRRLTFFGGELR